MENLKTACDTPEIVILDNFYPDLDWLFPYLDSQQPRPNTAVNYAGLVFSPPPITTIALQKIREFFKVQSLGHLTQGEIRLTTAKDQNQNQTLIHTDEGFNLVIYLSGKEEEGLGTNFYRHKELGLCSYIENDPLQKKMSILFEHDTKVLNRWILTHEVKFKKNRAVFFNGKYFHSVPQEFYGTNFRNGRLTQNFFFSQNRSG
jgi:hypothetical protein